MSSKLVIDDTDPQIAYSGEWTQPPGVEGERGLTVHETTQAGAAATFLFKGSAVKVLATIPSIPEGSAVATVNVGIRFNNDFFGFQRQARPFPLYYQTLFEAEGLGDGVHSLTVTQRSNVGPTVLPLRLDAIELEMVLPDLGENIPVTTSLQVGSSQATDNSPTTDPSTSGTALVTSSSTGPVGSTYTQVSPSPPLISGSPATNLHHLPPKAVPDPKRSNAEHTPAAITPSVQDPPAPSASFIAALVLGITLFLVILGAGIMYLLRRRRRRVKMGRPNNKFFASIISDLEGKQHQPKMEDPSVTYPSAPPSSISTPSSNPLNVRPLMGQKRNTSGSLPHRPSHHPNIFKTIVGETGISIPPPVYRHTRVPGHLQRSPATPIEHSKM